VKQIFLVGAGTGSREVLMVIDRINQRTPEWQFVGFVDENPKLVGTVIDGYPVFGPEHPFRGKDFYGSSGVQNPEIRQRLARQYVLERDCGLATLISPDVFLPSDFAAGPGCVIMPGATISFDVRLGEGVIVQWDAILGHELRVGDYSSILTAALITGGCRIGTRTVIGAGAILNIKVEVGDDALVGVGTTIIQNISSGKRVVALPSLVNLARSE
jgi:sugar O-acyltransferase (sialic acid O-acetyltransferase NeuD family)